MRELRLAASLLLLASSAAAGQPGTAGASFLSLGAGPRSVAMGEAQTAVADDAYAAYWNPAGLSLLRHPEAAATHLQMGQGLSHQFMAYAHPVGPGHALAASLTRLDAGEIESYDANGARRGSVDAGDLAVSAAYGRLLSSVSPKAPEVRVGAGGRYVREKLANASASTFAGDLGVMVGRLDNALGDKARGFRVGASVRNLGPGLKFHSERAPLPRSYAVALAWEGRPWGDPFTATLEMKSAVDDGARAGLGLEYWLKRVLAVRAGYLSGQDEGLGLRFGIGVRLKRVLVEYAMAAHGAVGDRHRIGLSYRFGGEADAPERSSKDFIAKGRAYLEQKRYFEAVTEFNKALDIDPGDRTALELMREALKSMEKPGGEK